MKFNFKIKDGIARDEMLEAEECIVTMVAKEEDVNTYGVEVVSTRLRKQISDMLDIEIADVVPFVEVG